MAGRTVDVGGKLERCKHTAFSKGKRADEKDGYKKFVKELIKVAAETSQAISLELLRDMTFNQKLY